MSCPDKFTYHGKGKCKGKVCCKSDFIRMNDEYGENSEYGLCIGESKCQRLIRPIHCCPLGKVACVGMGNCPIMKE